MTTPVHLLAFELVAITGYKQKAAQARWLKRQKIQYRLNAFGQPVVSRNHWDQCSGQIQRKSISTPNWGDT